MLDSSSDLSTWDRARSLSRWGDSNGDRLIFCDIDALLGMYVNFSQSRKALSSSQVFLLRYTNLSEDSWTSIPVVHLQNALSTGGIDQTGIEFALGKTPWIVLDRYQAGQQGDSGRTKAMRLLIAEDDRALAMFLTRGMEADGHRVRCAADGAEAVSAFVEEMPDLTILDLNLPVMDGEQALREMRAIDPGRDGQREPLSRIRKK